MPNAFEKKAGFPSSTPSSLIPQPESLTDVAVMLREAAEALSRFGATHERTNSGDSTSSAEECESCPLEDGYKRGEFHAEMRCFHVPSNIVEREYELLRQHKLEDFCSLVNMIYEDLLTTVMLMQRIDDGADFTGFELHLISENLSRPLKILNILCSQLADFELVEKTAVPA